MLKGLLSTLLLIGLAAGSVTVPGIFGRKIFAGKESARAELQKQNPGHPPAAGNLSEKTLPAGRGASGVAESLDNLQNIRQDIEKQIKDMPLEEQNLIRDAMPRFGEKQAKSLDRLLVHRKSGRQIISDNVKAELENLPATYKTLLAGYFQYETKILVYLWLIPGEILGLMTLLWIFKRYTLTMLLGTLVFTACGLALWLLSALAVIMNIFINFNMLGSMPQELWLSPVIYLLISAGMLRIMDINFPFRQKTASALSAPIVAAIICSGWWYFFEAVRKFLS